MLTTVERYKIIQQFRSRRHLRSAFGQGVGCAPEQFICPM
jgi:hypothetical protein